MSINGFWDLFSSKRTATKAPPSLGGKKWFDPCLTMRGSESTHGTVATFTENDPYDRVTVDFRGETLNATACHPGLAVGMAVCMIERPRGVWWATLLQSSWYMQPVIDLARAGRRSQAAVTLLMGRNPRYWPAVIMIDKRGQPIEPPGGADNIGNDPNPPDYQNNPLDPGAYYDPGSHGGFDWNSFNYFDRNNDGLVDRSEWPYDPDLFDVWDLNHDGYIDGYEWMMMGDTRYNLRDAPFFFTVCADLAGSVQWTQGIKYTNEQYPEGVAGILVEGATLGRVILFGGEAYADQLGNLAKFVDSANTSKTWHVPYPSVPGRLNYYYASIFGGSASYGQYYAEDLATITAAAAAAAGSAPEVLVRLFINGTRPFSTTKIATFEINSYSGPDYSSVVVEALIAF